MFTIDVRPWTDDHEEASTPSGVEKWLQRPESTPVGCSVDRIDESPMHINGDSIEAGGGELLQDIGPLRDDGQPPRMKLARLDEPPFAADHDGMSVPADGPLCVQSLPPEVRSRRTEQAKRGEQ